MYVDTEIEEDVTFHADEVEAIEYEFLQEHNLKSLRDATQNEFVAFLLVCKKRLFSHKELKMPNGYYDIEKVHAALDYLIGLVLMNNKILTKTVFMSFTGVGFDALQSWECVDTRYRDETVRNLTNRHNELVQKLARYSEESIQGLLTDGKKNPVGAMAILNHHYGWNMPGVREKADNKPQLTTRDELERIAANSQPLPELPNTD